jgi:hypothetical protein
MSAWGPLSGAELVLTSGWVSRKPCRRLCDEIVNCTYSAWNIAAFVTDQPANNDATRSRRGDNMSGATTPAVPRISQQKVNALSILSIVLAGLDVVAMIFWSAEVLAIFAVGAGHVALQQINARGERGAMLAYIALGISYLIATFVLMQFEYFFIVH